MWPNQRSDRILRLAAILFIVAGVPAAHAQCGSDDSTNIVYVDVTGCTALPDNFDVVIGDETVPVTRSADKKLWSGTTTSFVIGEGKLARADVPGFRTSCIVVAKPEIHGPCVARYRLQCEPVYRVFVNSQKQAKIDYERRSEKKYGTCENPAGSVQTPATLAVGSSDTVRVSTTSLFGSPIEGTLTFAMFELKPKWTMFEIIDPEALETGIGAHQSRCRQVAQAHHFSKLEFIKQ